MKSNDLVKWGAIAFGAYMLLKFVQTVQGINPSKFAAPGTVSDYTP